MSEKKHVQVNNYAKENGTKVKAHRRRKAGTLKCPRCGSKVKRAGTVKAGVRGGLRTIYFCTQCGYRTLDVREK